MLESSARAYERRVFTQKAAAGFIREMIDLPERIISTPYHLPSSNADVTVPAPRVWLWRREDLGQPSHLRDVPCLQERTGHADAFPGDTWIIFRFDSDAIDVAKSRFPRVIAKHSHRGKRLPSAGRKIHVRRI